LQTLVNSQLECSERQSLKYFQTNNHTCSVWRIAVLTNERLMSGSPSGEAKVWCLKSNRCIKTLKGHSNIITGIHEISVNNVATGSIYRKIKIWDLISGVCIKTIQMDYHYIQII
jgi:WD40 repeat protein